MELEIRRWIYCNSPCHSVSTSGDGQFIVVGHNYGIEIYNVIGDRLFAYPTDQSEFPVVQLANDPDFNRIYLLNRIGILFQLDTGKEGGRLFPKISTFYQSYQPDMNTLALSANGSKLALGYLSAGLAVFQKGGKYKRRHPEDGTATSGSYWSVALNDNGSLLYAGSASIGSSLNAVVAFDTDLPDLVENPVRYKLPIRSTVKNILTLSEQAVIIVVSEWDDSRQELDDHVIALSPSLEEKLWEISPGDLVTTLAVRPDKLIVVIAIGYYGKLMLIDGNTGKTIEYGKEILLNTMVNDFTVANDEIAAAATEDGHLVMLNFSG